MIAALFCCYYLLKNDISDFEKRNAKLRENLRSSLDKVEAGKAESFKLQQKFKVKALLVLVQTTDRLHL